jgi:nucleoid DNA-binding protein
MDELVKLISQKTGISQDQARQAVTQVIEFLKLKLPAPVANQVEAVLSGNVPNLGGLFGK